MITALLIANGGPRRLAVHVGWLEYADLLRLAATVGIAVLVRPALPLPPDIKEAAVSALVRILRAELRPVC